MTASAPHEPQPNPAPTPLRSHKERLEAIKAKLAAEHKKPEDVVFTALVAFIKAFLHVDRIPKAPDPLYEAHLSHIEQFAAQYGGQMLAHPKEEGEKAGDSLKIFVRKIDAWPAKIKDLAKQVAVKYYPDEVMNLLEFMEIDGLTEPSLDAFMFLYLLRISRNSLAAVRKAAVERKVSISAVVGNLDLDVADEKAVLSAVAGAM